MSYVEETLAPRETLLYRGRFHWLLYAGAYFTLAAFLAIALAAFLLVQDMPGFIASAVIAAVGVLVFLGVMVPVWTTEIGVTNHRIIYKRGWLRRVTDELQLGSIEEVNLEQTVLGRLFGYGRLVLHGTGVNDIKLPLLADPIGLRRALQEGMAGAKGAVLTPADPGEPLPHKPAVRGAA